MSDRINVLSLTAQIVSAHISRKGVTTDRLPQLISDVHHALMNSDQGTSAVPKNEPAVDVKRSVRSSYIVCLECGEHFSMLKRHLRTDHQLSADQYREKWGLPKSYPMVAPEYAKVRSEIAKDIGLGQMRSKRKRR